jgi:hypothetical protein
MFYRKITATAFSLLAAALLFTACGNNTARADEDRAEAQFEMPAEPHAAIQAIMRELAEGNGGALWLAMPSSYQSDLNSLAQLAGTKLDSEVYDKVFTIVSRIAEVADKQKEFVFNTSLRPNASEEETARLREAWPTMMQLLETISSSSASSTARLQNFEGESFFNNTVSAILEGIDTLAKLQPDADQPVLSDYASATIRVLEETDTEASLEITLPDAGPEVENFLKVDGRWVPQELASKWMESMAEAQASLEAFDPAEFAAQKSQIMSVFMMIDGVLMQIEAAETQEQFDESLQGAMMPMMGIIMMFQGMGGNGPAPMAPPVAP